MIKATIQKTKKKSAILLSAYMIIEGIFAIGATIGYVATFGIGIFVSFIGIFMDTLSHFTSHLLKKVSSRSSKRP